MTIHMVSTAVGAALLALLATPSMAEVTLDQIDPSDPFGAIDVDVAGGDVMADTLEEAQNAELKERCNLLIANPAPFTDQDLQFCIVYMGRDNEGLTAEGLKKAAAASGAASGAVPAATGSTQANPVQPQPPSPELGAEGVPEGNQ